MYEIKENQSVDKEDMDSVKENNDIQITPIPENENKEDINQLTERTESEGTVQLGYDNYEVDNSAINFNLENNEFKEILEGTPVEDIDNYIDNIRNRFNKAKMMRLNTVTKQPMNSQNTENTICNNYSNTNNNIIFEDICK